MIELPWDPEVDSPATIAIIGGGPVGIEAAIYARFLGYFVSIFEQRRVAHRMLDWHERPLAVSAHLCTTPMGHAAIQAQEPDYQRCKPDHVYSGKSYAEEYLLPLAKSDLLFDDIHFLSPVADVSRIRTTLTDAIHPQERCNDEFRILIDGRHRGPWVSLADVVIDCRGCQQQSAGLGPGGGLAIGESALRESFLLHTPRDRKFVTKSIAGKHVCVVGQTVKACQFVTEFATHYPDMAETRLTWVIRPDRCHDSAMMTESLQSILPLYPTNVVILEALGVEQIDRNEAGCYLVRLLKDDNSCVELKCDAVVSMTGSRTRVLSNELHPGMLRESAEVPAFVSNEPGLYVLQGGDLEDGAGVGLAQAFDNIRQLFAMLAGREDLDLYGIIEKQNHGI